MKSATYVCVNIFIIKVPHSLSALYKILFTILLTRLTNNIGEIIRNLQCGF